MRQWSVELDVAQVLIHVSFKCRPTSGADVRVRHYSTLVHDDVNVNVQTFLHETARATWRTDAESTRKSDGQIASISAENVCVCPCVCLSVCQR